MNLKSLSLPNNYNYIACFLTFDCQLKCNYCINRFNNDADQIKTIMSGKNWVRGLNRLTLKDDVPVTLQGGEPTLHPDFFYIIKNIRPDINIDILTNLNFDIKKFIQKIPPSRLKRKAPYASIRASYHPGQIRADEFIQRLLALKEAGFSIGGYGILHPAQQEHILDVKNKCDNLKLDFRTKEFLGIHKNKLYGTFKYPDAVLGQEKKRCQCRPTELIVGPISDVYRCHHDIYKSFPPIGNLLDPDFTIKDDFMTCDNYGDCNPCDIKLKTDRFQIFGHCSVQIKDS